MSVARGLLALICLVALAACVSDPDPLPAPTRSATEVASLQPVTLREALADPAYGEQVRLTVALVTEGGVPFLCDEVEDSDPEQCGEPSVEIVDAPLDDLDLVTRSGERAGEVDLIVVLVDEDAAEYVSSAP